MLDGEGVLVSDKVNKFCGALPFKEKRWWVTQYDRDWLAALLPLI